MKVSTKAKPIIVKLNKVSSKSGAQPTPLMKDENIKPVATAHPNNGKDEKLKAKTFIDLMNIIKTLKKKQRNIIKKT